MDHTNYKKLLGVIKKNKIVDWIQPMAHQWVRREGPWPPQMFFIFFSIIYIILKI